MTLISVIIPTFNRAGYLPRAIDSVLQQGRQDVEIIVVDDGSTDDTRAKVAAYGDRVKYIFTKNGGAAHARNVGTRSAEGRYLTFLDSDDLHYPYTLDLQSRILDRYPDVAMVYTEMSGFDDHGFFDRYHLKKYHESGYRHGLTYDRIFSASVPLAQSGLLTEAITRDDPGVRDRRAYFGNIFDRYLTDLVLFTNSTMLRRDVLPGIGERNERLKFFEELDFTLRIARNHRICFVDVPAYKLRYHEGQISTTARPDGRYVWMRKQQTLLRVVKRQALQDRAYYERHRARIDRYLAHLHRAVAVPLMLSQPRARSSRRNVRAARTYLARCSRLGHPQRALWLLTFAPGPLRRLGTSLIEAVGSRIRQRSERLSRRFGSHVTRWA